MKQKNWMIVIRGFALIGVCVLSSCITTQHYNNGKTLKSGKHVVVWGLGVGSILTCDDRRTWGNEGEYKSNTKLCVEEEGESIEKEVIPIVSRRFRLGVRNSWGPFTGVDIGYALEAPSGVEFDGRLGLPHIGDNIFHSVSAGWGIGLWADNSWFLEYAISKDMGSSNIYFNIRESWVATQGYDIYWDESGDKLFEQNKHFITQFGTGFRYEGIRQPWFPNIFYAHCSATFYPISQFDRIEGDMVPFIQLSPSVGVGWTY